MLHRILDAQQRLGAVGEGARRGVERPGLTAAGGTDDQEHAVIGGAGANEDPGDPGAQAEFGQIERRARPVEDPQDGLAEGRDRLLKQAQRSGPNHSLDPRPHAQRLVSLLQVLLDGAL
jgi:hypothetical protein